MLEVGRTPVTQASYPCMARAKRPRLAALAATPPQVRRPKEQVDAVAAARLGRVGRHLLELDRVAIADEINPLVGLLRQAARVQCKHMQVGPARRLDG